MQEHSLEVRRSARYYTLGAFGPSIRYCWLVCHGYGQLAGRFIRKFESVQNPETFVIAPEGLSRFYWGGVSGEVAASWMTKADRLREIDDYCRYLDQLRQLYLDRLPPKAEIILLGFSQGCATQMRWIMQSFPRFDYLVLWAGALPEDLDYRPHRDYFADKSLHFIYGRQDEYLNEEMLRAQQTFFAQQELAFNMHAYEGRHRVDRQMLRRWAREVLA